MINHFINDGTYINQPFKTWRPDLSNISPKAHIGEGTIIHAGVHIHEEVMIGRKCKIEAMVFIPNGVTLEDEVFIGPGTIFTNDPDMSDMSDSWKPTPTLVKKGAKIGANATIRAGVTIGECAIIGCGSVVLKDVPSGETWAGVPAKPI